MMKLLIFLLPCLLLFCSCSNQTANGDSLPDVGLAEITTVNYYEGKISDKFHENDRDLYFVKVKSDNSLFRFHAGKDYYNHAQIGQKVIITACMVNYPLGGSEVRYYIGKEELTGVLFETLDNEKYIKPYADYGFATLTGEENCDYTITGLSFEIEKHYCGNGVYSSIHHYYIFTESESGERVQFDDENLYNNRTIGDVLHMVVHLVDYPLSGRKNVYYIDGILVRSSEV